MKKLLLLTTILLMFGITKAQIAEVKQEGNFAKIYDDQGIYTGYYIYLPSGSEVSGYNSEYIVVTEDNFAKIYDSKGRYTGNYIYLSEGAYVKYVSATVILVKERKFTKYYDFKGKYTGKYTYNQ